MRLGRRVNLVSITGQGDVWLLLFVVICTNIIYPLTLPEFSLCYLILFFYATLGSVDLAWTPSESVYYVGRKYNSRGTVLKLG